jgi:dolichol-phosphate mannosyltransferase
VSTEAVLAAVSPPQISVVVPLYNEEENIPELYRQVTASLEALGLSFELALIDDGSTDLTPQLLDDLHEKDERVMVLHLSRNFGHQAAVSAGLDAVRGQAVLIIDGDLQDPPEVFGQFIARWQEGYEVVYAVRANRKEHAGKRLGYFLFYRLLRAISDLDIPVDSGDFCLMDRRVVDVLKHLPEQMRFVRGLRSFVGFRQCGICYERAARRAGQPKYSFRMLLRLAIEGLVSFSAFPLTLVTYLGFLSAGLALVLTLWALGDAFLNPATPRGWASTMVVVLFMGSIQLLCQGILGEYIRRIFLECKGRPTYIVRDFKSSGADNDDLLFPPRRKGAARANRRRAGLAK